MIQDSASSGKNVNPPSARPWHTRLFSRHHLSATSPLLQSLLVSCGSRSIDQPPPREELCQPTGNMAYSQPVHGGEADSYYQQGQQGTGTEMGMGMQQPQQNQYSQQPYQQQQLPYPDQPQQYPQQPPRYGKPPMQSGSGEKLGFDQTFKVDKPKLNDVWAAILFVATFAGFVAVSGLSIYGYSSTKGTQGGGIYDSDVIGVALNTNTIILLCVPLV
jgi:hypothetical protein